MSATSIPISPLTNEAGRRQLTVMFCDLVGSTALSARLDPETSTHLRRLSYPGRFGKSGPGVPIGALARIKGSGEPIERKSVNARVNKVIGPAADPRERGKGRAVADHRVSYCGSC